MNMNYFTKVKTTITNADYFRVEQRKAAKQRRIVKAYKERIADKSFGSTPFILNIEELATVYHFPGMTVKAPLMKLTESKRSEPPVTLPIDQEFGPEGMPEVVIPGENSPAPETGGNKGLTKTEAAVGSFVVEIPPEEDYRDKSARVTENALPKVEVKLPTIEPAVEDKMDEPGMPPENLPV
jgi:hypothetical protein